jgi:hypothetical protein
MNRERPDERHAAGALSPVHGGADALAALKQLVLDAVSSPLTRDM